MMSCGTLYAMYFNNTNHECTLTSLHIFEIPSHIARKGYMKDIQNSFTAFRACAESANLWQVTLANNQRKASLSTILLFIHNTANFWTCKFFSLGLFFVIFACISYWECHVIAGVLCYGFDSFEATLWTQPRASFGQHGYWIQRTSRFGFFFIHRQGKPGEIWAWVVGLCSSFYL